MCFDSDSTPPIPPISGAAITRRDLVLDAEDAKAHAESAAQRAQDEAFSARIATERGDTSMPRSSAICPRSIRFAGPVSRCFMVGRSVCPPARIRASSTLPRRPTACRRLVGR